MQPIQMVQIRKNGRHSIFLLLVIYLMLNEGKEFSTSDLLAHVWKDDEEASEDVVWIYISYLRQKLQSIQSSVQIVGEKGGSFSLIR